MRATEAVGVIDHAAGFAEHLGGRRRGKGDCGHRPGFGAVYRAPCGHRAQIQPDPTSRHQRRAQFTQGLQARPQDPLASLSQGGFRGRPNHGHHVGYDAEMLAHRRCIRDMAQRPVGRQVAAKHRKTAGCR